MTATTTALADGEEARLTEKFTLVHAPGTVEFGTRSDGSETEFAELATTEVAPDVYLIEAPNATPTLRVSGGAATMIEIS